MKPLFAPKMIVSEKTFIAKFRTFEPNMSEISIAITARSFGILLLPDFSYSSC